MSYTLLEALKKCGYRENLKCSNIKVLNLEISVSKNSREILNSMGVNVYENMLEKDSKHSLYTTAMIKEFLPEAKVSLFPNDINAFIEWYNDSYNIIGLSISAFNVGFSAQEKLSKYSYMMASAGNSGENSGYPLVDKYFDLIGACDYDNVLRPYSSYGLTKVDYVGIDGFELMGTELLGTSFSRPFQTILVSQLLQLFYNNYKFFPTPMQTHHLVKKYCVDIEDIGYDIKTGSGLFILPKDEDLKFFGEIDIPQEIFESVNLDSNGYILHVNDNNVNLQENSRLNASLLAYVVRRHLSDNRLSSGNILFNLKTMSEEVFKLYLNDETTSMVVKKLEKGDL